MTNVVRSTHVSAALRAINNVIQLEQNDSLGRSVRSSSK
jgi:hypothetical protein